MSNPSVSELTLDKLIDNPPVTLEVPGVGIVKVHRPTIGDRKKARRDTMLLLDYDKLNDTDRDSEFINILVMNYMLDSPKIKPEDSDNIDSNMSQAIVDVVSAWLATINNDLNNQRKGLIQSFLQQMKEKNQ
jgi:hypothetical protein